MGEPTFGAHSPYYCWVVGTLSLVARLITVGDGRLYGQSPLWPTEAGPLTLVVHVPNSNTYKLTVEGALTLVAHSPCPLSVDEAGPLTLVVHLPYSNTYKPVMEGLLILGAHTPFNIWRGSGPTHP